MTVIGLIVQFSTSKGTPLLPNEAPRKTRKRKAYVRNIQAAEVTRDPGESLIDGGLPTLINSGNQNKTLRQESDDVQFPTLIESNTPLRRNNQSQLNSFVD